MCSIRSTFTSNFRCVVWTGDGRVFFYNPSTRTSVWERPEDLLGRSDVDKAVSTTPEQLLATQSKDENKPATVTIVESNKKRPESESSGDETEMSNKKLKMDVVSAGKIRKFQRTAKKIQLFRVFTVQSTNKQPEKKADIGKEAAIEAEVRAARERALVPLEIRVKSFKEMLKEKDVSSALTP